MKNHIWLLFFWEGTAVARVLVKQTNVELIRGVSLLQLPFPMQHYVRL